MNWSWDVPTGVDDVGYLVQQTDEIDSKSPTVYGFSSGSQKSKRGKYSYKFTELGTFYYWSGPVNPSGK